MSPVVFAVVMVAAGLVMAAFFVGVVAQVVAELMSWWVEWRERES